MAGVRHNCGYGVTHTLHDAYSFGKSVQNRGREAFGFAAIGDTIDVIKAEGQISRFDLEDLHDIFPGHHYHTFVVHVRYATSGRKDKVLEDAHPHTIGGKAENRGNHRIIRDCEAIIAHNGQVDEKDIPANSRRRLNTGCDSERLLHCFFEDGEDGVLRGIPGAYSMVAAVKGRDEVVVMRDPLGIKPGVLGKKDGKIVVASEDSAIRENGGEFLEDLEPGCAYYLSSKGNYRKSKLNKGNQRAHCMFEFQYIMKKRSTSDSVSVYLHRRNLGAQLAEEFVPEDATLVSYVPRCPETAAREFSKVTGIPFLKIFYKLNDERSFLGSTTLDRENSIRSNLHLLPGIENRIKDETIAIIEDSVIRGNVGRRVRELLYEVAHVKKAYLIVFTPPLCIVGEDGVKRGCKFGVDMPPEPPEGEEYIARGRTMDEISEVTGMPVHYISHQGLLDVFRKSGLSGQKLCTYCIGGEHPFKRLTLRGE